MSLLADLHARRGDEFCRKRQDIANAKLARVISLMYDLVAQPKRAGSLHLGSGVHLGLYQKRIRQAYNGLATVGDPMLIAYDKRFRGAGNEHLQKGGRLADARNRERC